MPEMGLEGVRVDDVALDATEAESESVLLHMLDLVDDLRLRRLLHRPAVSFAFQNGDWSWAPQKMMGPLNFYNYFIIFAAISISIFFIVILNIYCKFNQVYKFFNFFFVLNIVNLAKNFILIKYLNQSILILSFYIDFFPINSVGKYSIL